ncbi:MAG: hypothetical protein EOO25_14215 [Comamonadaceae bacterium]|nr:MAG: hypothetical protein EOO25_14215 [Comamonadaceae bacterium]
MTGAVAERAAPRTVVLAGGGHSHALVLRQWMREPLEGAQVVMVSNTAFAPYSGMLPGEIAGHYRHDETHIDLERLCRASGARFILAQAAGIDRAGRRLLLADGSLPYDLLSLNIGATPSLQVPGAAEHAVPVKPIAGFGTRWHALLQRAREASGPLAIAVVGTGAAGVELALAIEHRLRRALGPPGQAPDRLTLHLLGAGAAVLAAHPPRVQRRFMHLLAARGIQVHLGARVEAVHVGGLRTSHGLELAADEVIWVTQAAAAPWLATTGLALDGAGFVRVNASLRSVNEPAVFAAGDVASVDGEALEKAGVVAVRQAPVLAENLRRALAGQPLRQWKPQRQWLSLISTGDRHAVASRGPFSAAGRWVWHWKDAIDRRFMRQFDEGSAP